MDYYACVEATANPTEDGDVPALSGLSEPEAAVGGSAALKRRATVAAPELGKVKAIAATPVGSQPDLCAAIPPYPAATVRPRLDALDASARTANATCRASGYWISGPAP
jgi:hypothetical protein